MTQRGTQPPAETLAINHARECLRTIGETKHVQIKRDALETLLAALTRRASGNAIPAGMKPWHGGDAAPADWDLGAVLGADGKLYEPDGWDGEIDWRHNLGKRGIGIDIIAYTPKPSVGGDAGAVGLPEAARLALMYLETGFIECPQCGHEVPTKDLDAVWQIKDGLAALALPAPVVEGEPWRHVKRGTIYEVIGYAELQNGNVKGLREGAELAVYRGEDGKLWARERGEFHDGRFAAVSEGRSHG